MSKFYQIGATGDKSVENKDREDDSSTFGSTGIDKPKCQFGYVYVGGMCQKTFD